MILQLLFAGNIREIGAYEKARFVREGLLRQAAHIDGQWVDVVPMGFMLDVVCMARVRGLDD